jgi:hypothetical protein
MVAESAVKPQADGPRRFMLEMVARFPEIDARRLAKVTEIKPPASPLARAVNK